MAKEKILIVEDEEDIRELIHFHLFKNKYEVLEAAEGNSAFSIAQTEKPDLIILDIMIPGLDGIGVCRKIKEDPSLVDSKIIFLSAKGEEADIIKGLELGADDYITKPFSPKILMARIKAALRRQESEKNRNSDSQGIKILFDKRKVIINDEAITLTSTEFDVLSLLINSPGHVYTRSQIVNSIKGHNHAVTDRSVDTQLVSLRKKLGPKGKLIETVWGVGYRFRDNEA